MIMKRTIPFKNFLREPEKKTDSELKYVPTEMICLTIQFLLDELSARGVGIFDWDYQTKRLQSVKHMRGEYFFLAAEDEGE